MFKSARWRSEKNKIKAVFKLQFYATQVTGDALMISVVPADVGKATLRLEKSVVHNGSCYWENAAYETVKFNQDPKSVKIHEKIYNFVVGTASSKAGVVGEASVDFSKYADATKVSYVSLPLKNSKSGAILHVSIKRVQDYADQSVNEESEHEKPSPRDRTLKAKFNNVDTDEGEKTDCIDEPRLDKTVSHVPTLNGQTESGESDTTLSSSESSLGLDTPREVETKNENTTDDVSTDGSSSASENASDVIEKLRSELAALARQADLSELELQTLRKQIVKENKRGQELSREIVSLREERDALKEELQKEKASPRDSEGVRDIVEELRQELNHQKEINANLQIQLQKTQESNSELVLAVRDLDEMLEQKNKEITNLSRKSANLRAHSDAEETYLLEQKIADIERDKDELEMQMEQLALDYEILKQENHEMQYKLEQSEIQEQLKMQYECSSYATVNELEAQVESLENELKKQSKEFEDRVKSLEEELEIQARGFETDLEALALAKVEQEQRAIRAEEELRKTRWQNANTAERLQMEFKRLCVQIESSFEANEKMASKALAEAIELRSQKRNLEITLRKSSEELENTRKAMKEMESKIINGSNDLKEKIKLLEGQITLKENALESSCNTFLEKEKDVRNKVEELEVRLEELNQNTAKFCDLLPAKAAIEDRGVNSETTKQVKSLSDEETKPYVCNNRDLDKLSNEVALLRETNTSMEFELKEMQERYSEISLKFAEVEGERQQLVMKLRSRKNVKKSSE